MRVKGRITVTNYNPSKRSIN